MISSLTACSKDAPARGRTFVMGDPMEIIAGATLQPKLDESFFKDVASVDLFMFFDFIEKQNMPALLNNDELEEENSAGRDVTQIIASFKVMTVEGEIRIVDPRYGFGMIMTPTAESGIYKLRANLRGQVAEGEILHFSRSADGNIASLLIKGSDRADGVTLTALYFARNWRPVQPDMADKKFKFIGGDGVKVKWATNTIQMDVCGEKAVAYQRSVREALMMWGFAMPTGVTTRVDVVDKYSPFSDLNQRCTYFIDSYFTEARQDRANFGLTAPVVDGNNFKIVDSDVFILVKEFEKLKLPFGDYRLQRHFDYTLVHEFGHFLGLDHQFTDGIASVMSYDFGYPVLSDYDRAAIRALYE